MTHRLVLIFGLFLACQSALAMDCTLSRDGTEQAWKASCGLQRGGSHWTGFIQGPLLGSHLFFSNADKKISVEGGVLSPLLILSEIPSCHSPTSADNEACKLIAKKTALTLPFELISYTQDPIAFTVGSRWDSRAKTIAHGSELVIAACGMGPERKSDETEPLLYFRKTMACQWNELPTHPLAVNCKSPTQDGLLEVNAGSIRCELRQRGAQKISVMTDLMPVVCIPPSGKFATADAIDPITCLADDRVGFTTQTELRGKLKIKRPGKTVPAAKGASGINGI